MSTLRTYPALIYLQREEHSDQYAPGHETTWCRDPINEADVEYIRIDLYNSLRMQLKRATGNSP